MESSKMDIQMDQESCRRTKILETPAPCPPTKMGDDSGYLSHSQCSSFNETHSNSSSASFSGFPYSSRKLHSLCDEGISMPSSSMDISDSLSLENGFTEPKAKVFCVPVDLLPVVHQSTPAAKRLCVNLLKEFEFVTPLPGPSYRSSSNSGSLAGQAHVDILSVLSQRGVTPPLQQILSYLEPEDLCQLRLVSSSWRKLLLRFPQAKVWQSFVRVRQQNKENSLLNIAKAEDMLVTPVLTRSQLRDIHNLALVPARQPSHSPPVSPSKLHSSRYLKEGQKLKSGEKLRKCPKCAWPARVDSCKTGVRCTGRLCGFHFCVDCSGPFHDAAPCDKIAPVTPTKATNRAHRAHKLNKKRLHRLLF